MNIKNGLICLLIVAVLSICTFNDVVAAPTSKSITTDGMHITDVRTDLQPTTLTLSAPAQATVNNSYSMYGRLTTASGTAIPGAEVRLMLWAYGSTWIQLGDSFTTNSDGSFGWDITQRYSGGYEHEVVYYGDMQMQYAGSISNVITTTVS